MKTPINSLLAQATVGQPTPTIGMGATILLWSDRHAATIVKAETIGKTRIVTTRDDTVRVTAGSTHDGSAVYSYTQNPIGRRRSFRAVGPDGAWQEVTFNEETQRWSRVRGGGAGLRIGAREEYRDPSH
jgi:hypothetical protein